MTVGIVDCGLGNVLSIERMFEAVDVDAHIITNPAEIGKCNKLVLPGVGAFDTGMALLSDGGWTAPLTCAAIDQAIPILGICLGMQLLCRASEEGARPGLGWIDADVRLLDRGGSDRLKLPHMGWAVTCPERDNLLIPVNGEDKRFYYVHKYAVHCDKPEDVLATAVHGNRFTASLQRGNIFGVQFHPEKSHRFGKELLRRFGSLAC